MADTGGQDGGPTAEVIVSIAEDRLSALPEMLERLRRAGLVVRDVLEPIGTVTGSVAASSVAALETVPGVLAVERQRDVRLPPEGDPQ